MRVVSRVGLGCMRLSEHPTVKPGAVVPDENHGEANGLATIAAALDAGTTWLDTARAYGGPNDLGRNERLVARALMRSNDAREATSTSTSTSTGMGAGTGRHDIHVVTKCGMARPDDGGWKPDGRASTIVSDARASVAALGGRPPDLLLLHVPDPAVPFATSLRALARAKEAGLARAIGLSNVTRKQLDAAAAILMDTKDNANTATVISAVEVAMGAYDDAPARGGVVAWCKERGVTLLAHAPLGGPSRAKRLDRDQVLRVVAARHRKTPAEIVIAYLLSVDAIIVPIVGARSPSAATSAMRAGDIVLDEQDFAVLDARFPGLAMIRKPTRSPTPETASAEVVIVMGLVGSGKSRLATSYVERGYERLNRDTIGGTLNGVAQKLGDLLERGTKRIVLDNTYVTRASRSEVLRVAHARGALVRCVYLETPSSEAQVNVTTRMLEKHGELLGGVELKKRAKVDANLFDPNTLFRMEKQIERPLGDEGFASIETIPFVRAYEPTTAAGSAGVALPIELILKEQQGALFLRDDAAETLSRVPKDVPVLLYGWRPGADAAWQQRASEKVQELTAAAEGDRRTIDIGICAHPSGPPVCWCRPPLPGLWLAFARRHKLDPRLSLVFAVSPTQRTMAQTLGIHTMS